MSDPKNQTKNYQEYYILTSIKELKTDVRDLDIFIRDHMEKEEGHFEDIMASISRINVDLAKLETKVATNDTAWNRVWLIIVPVIVSLVVGYALNG